MKADSQYDERHGISAGYTIATRLGFMLVGALGTALLGFGFAKHTDKVDRSTLVLSAVILGVWVCALLDAFNRRIWVLNDRVVYRNLFWRRSTFYYHDIRGMKEGTDRVILTAADGRSVTVLRRMEHYDRIATALAAKMGHTRAGTSRRS